MPSSSQETVLVVDDDPLVRRALGRELGQVYRVTQAGSVSEALAHLREDTSICAVVSDFDMGAETGLDLLDEVRRVAPLCARIIVSGKAVPRRMDLCDVIVEKPWRPGSLKEAVQDVWIRL